MASKRKSNSKAGKPDTTGAMVKAALIEGAPVVETLERLEHDPIEALVRVGMGMGGIEPNTTAMDVIRFLDAMIERFPATAAAASALKPRVQRELLYFVDQKEINRVNMELAKYVKPTLKAVDPTTGDAVDRKAVEIVVRFESSTEGK